MLRDLSLKSLCIGDFGISLSLRREKSVISVGVLGLKAAEIDIGWNFFGLFKSLLNKDYTESQGRQKSQI